MVDTNPPLALWYKSLSSQNVLASLQSLFPSAVLSGDYIVFTDAVPGHQNGDEYAIRITQANSTTTDTIERTLNIGGVIYSCHLSYAGWVDTGEFSEITSSSDEFTDTNIIGRKIKFQLESNQTIKSWAEGINVVSGEIYFSDGNYYIATGTGTTGSVQPIHHQGIVSDGAITWEYFHSGFGTATVVSVQDSQNLTAVVEGFLPVLQTGGNNYTWRNYQWSMWGYHGYYPSQVFFFKGRLGYFCPTDGWGCWLQLSKTDSFYDFGTESFGQVLDTCAINQLVTGHKDNNINWVLSGDRLYCGSYSGEYNIFGSNSAVSPTDCIIDPVTNIGGAPIQALRFSGLNLFVGRLSDEIYSIQYDYTTDDYAPDNIGFMSSHMLEQKVSRWVSLSNQDRNIYLVTEAQTLRIINYVKETKTLGYYRIDLDGNVLDTATSDAGPHSAAYFMVNRDTGCFIEIAASENPNYMLAAQEIELVSLAPVTLTDYAGHEVWVKNEENGMFYKTTIGEHGEFDNQYEWLHFSVGLPMNCVMYGQPPAGEKLEGLQQKSVKFIVRLKNCGMFSYGSSVDFSKKFDYNVWNILDSQEWDMSHKLLTGDIQLPSSFGYTVGQNRGTGPYPNDTGVALNVYADSPEPFTLLSISTIYV